jgi:hypothetical protein
VRLIQLKGSKAGISRPEIARLKKAASEAVLKWLIPAYDGSMSFDGDSDVEKALARMRPKPPGLAPTAAPA